MLDKLPLNGKKTYVVAILVLLNAVSGLLLGYHDGQEALMMIGGALGLTTIGHKIDKASNSSN